MATEMYYKNADGTDIWRCVIVPSGKGIRVEDPDGVEQCRYWPNENSPPKGENVTLEFIT